MLEHKKKEWDWQQKSDDRTGPDKTSVWETPGHPCPCRRQSRLAAPHLTAGSTNEGGSSALRTGQKPPGVSWRLQPVWVRLGVLYQSRNVLSEHDDATSRQGMLLINISSSRQDREMTQKNTPDGAFSRVYAIRRGKQSSLTSGRVMQLIFPARPSAAGCVIRE